MENTCKEPRWAQTLEELLKDRLSLQLDLNNPKHEAFFMEYYGGEEQMKNNCPHIYQAYLRTKNSGTADEGEKDYVTDYAAIPPSIVPTDRGVAQNSGDQDKICTVYSSIITNVKEAISGVVVSGFIKDDATGRTHASIYEEFDETDIARSRYHVVANFYNALNVTDTEGFITRGVIHYYTNHEQIVVYAVQSRESQGAKIVDMVESIEITHPRSYKAIPNNPLRIIYKDRDSSTADYPYKDVKPEGNRVKTMLPIEGTITLKGRFLAHEFSMQETEDIKTIYARDIPCYFGYSLAEINGFFEKKTEKKIHFKFPDAWKGDMNSESYGHNVEAFLSCPFYYTLIDPDEIGDKKYKNIPFLIHSENELLPGREYYSSTGMSDVIIPPINYLWGCLGKDTMIRMADGSTKKISAVERGDLVWVYQDSPMRVQENVTGSEPVMVCVEVEDGSSLLLTNNHPVMTKRGIVLANRLNAADYLILEDGRESMVKFLYDEPYNDQVYCLDLGKSCMIGANGLLAGDFNCQNGKNDINVQPSKNTEEFLREMRELREMQK